MSDQFDPNLPVPEPFVKGKYSLKKAGRTVGVTGTSITGFTIAGNYLAPMVLAYAERFKIPIPVEVSIGVMAGLIAGLLAWAYDVARYRGLLDWTKRSE